LRAGVLLNPVWAVDGQRLELAWGVGATVLLDGKATDLWVPRPRGRLHLTIGGHAVELQCDLRHGSRVEFIDVYCEGKLVPPMTSWAPGGRAPPDAWCVVHPRIEAAVICGRCGAFACARCGAPTGVFCGTCGAAAEENAPLVSNRARRDGPAIALGFNGGLLGARLAIALFPGMAGGVFFLGALLGAAVGIALGVANREAFARWVGWRRRWLFRLLAWGVAAVVLASVALSL
jgi:hypothetical protein